MNEEPGESKTWLERLSDLLLREPTDRAQLIELLRNAEGRHILDADALTMMEGVLQVSDMKVRDIMIPRSQMTTIADDTDLETALPIIIESGHSRFPVIGEDRDEVAGILLAKELLIFVQDQNKKFNARKLMRPAVFVPESKRLDALLKEFRANHNHMAIVVDEYGNVSGLVTIEDVLEQIVGEIEDESDRDEDEIHIKDLGDGVYTVKALTSIVEFNLFFNTDFSDEEFDTIGGLVMQSFGYLPKRDEETDIGNCHFKVLHADNRRIRLLKLNIK